MNAVGRQLVIDASALVALLVDAGDAGHWAERTVEGYSLAAPELVPYEAANILRRHSAAGLLDPSNVTMAHADLLALPIELWPYAPLAERAWALRNNLSIYDASYVSLAELLDAPLVTLDARIARAPGVRCPVFAHSSA